MRHYEYSEYSVGQDGKISRVDHKVLDPYGFIADSFDTHSKVTFIRQRAEHRIKNNELSNSLYQKWNKKVSAKQKAKQIMPMRHANCLCSLMVIS